jgi:hypothetical protein
VFVHEGRMLQNRHNSVAQRFSTVSRVMCRGGGESPGTPPPVVASVRIGVLSVHARGPVPWPDPPSFLVHATATVGIGSPC